MKDKKNGFTLIEILAVIIIIGIIAVIAVPSINKYISDSKNSVYKSYEESMVEAAQNKVSHCLEDNIDCDLPESNGSKKINLNNLIEEGFIENMKDPNSKDMCDVGASYVEITGTTADDYQYKACLRCGYYASKNTCTEIRDDGDVPECKETTGESTKWTNQNRTITIRCSDRTSGCQQVLFSKTFKDTGKTGVITIRDNSNNTKDCTVNTYIDKEVPTCNITADGEYLSNVGWYVLEATAKIENMVDTHSGVLTYGIGTSLTNRDYNKKTELKVGKGITTVIGYVKDIAGNEGICTEDIRVSTDIPKFNLYYGYQIYPTNKDEYTLSGITENGTNLTTNNTTPKMTINGLSKYQNVEKVVITLNSALDATTTARLKTNTSLTKTATMQSGSKEIVFKFAPGEVRSYSSFEIQFGTINNKTYSIKKIEILTKDGSAWTNKDITMYVEPIDRGMQTTEVSFDNGAHWTTSFTKVYTTKTSNTIKTRNRIGMVSNPQSFTTKIDKVVPTMTTTAKRVSNNNTVLSGAYTNEGLNFVFNKGTVGESGATMYYCKDTNNTCVPNTMVNNGETVTSYNTIKTDYYIRYKIVSNAGSSSNVNSYNAKFDLDSPTCTNSGDGTNYVSSRTIYYGCNDTLSGCDPSYSGGNKPFTTTTVTATIAAYEIRDTAGNKTTCPARTANVYVDKTPPSCTDSGDSTTFATSRTIYYGCRDDNSECNPSYSGGNKPFTTTTITSTISSYEIRDNVGNTTICPARTANVYVDTTGPTCSMSSGSTVDIGNTGTIELTCTDSYNGVSTSNLSSSDFNLSNNNFSIQSVSASNVSNGKKYTVTLKAASNGTTTITLKSGVVKDGLNNASESTPSATMTGRKTATLSYSCNGGSGSVSASSCTYTTESSCSVSLNANGCYKDNYDFKGWSTSSSSESGTAPGTSVSISSDTTYYAAWKLGLTTKTVITSISSDSNSKSFNVNISNGYTSGTVTPATSNGTINCSYESSSQLSCTVSNMSGSSPNTDAGCVALAQSLGLSTSEVYYFAQSNYVVQGKAGVSGCYRYKGLGASFTTQSWDCKNYDTTIFNGETDHCNGVGQYTRGWIKIQGVSACKCYDYIASTLYSATVQIDYTAYP